MDQLAPTQTREHSSFVWENHREQITQLYSVGNKSLEEVINIMESERGFIATQRQYKSRISKWHLDKKIKGPEYEFMAQVQAKRAREDKDTNFILRGHPVDPEKISRTLKRKKISEEELLVMPSVPTPPDISYGTPSAVGPQSPYVQQTVAHSPGPNFEASTNQIPTQSAWNKSEWQNQAYFLVSPYYQPATPLPVVCHGPSTPLPSTSFQTPPGMLQSPGSLWNTAAMDSMIEDGDVVTIADDSDVCRIKCDRLIELVIKTEKTEISDYMETMSEVNSQVYDLIISDQQRSQVSAQEDSASIPACYVCRALDVIGSDDMAAKVESERILLEAIAVCEGLFGEEHRGAFHFRVKLCHLYEDWECRSDSWFGVILRTMSMAWPKAPSLKAPEFLSDLLDVSDFAERTQCAWLQDSSGGYYSGTSSRKLSTLSIRDGTYPAPPFNTWEILCAVIDRVGIVDEELDFEIGPFLEKILHQGAESPDVSSYFWMATFTAVWYEMWPVIHNSKTSIGNAAGENMPGSKAINLGLKRLELNPRRLVKHQQKSDDLSKLNGPLESVEELRCALAEFSLLELEKADNGQNFPSFLFLASSGTFAMHTLLSEAAGLGKSTLITKLSEHFGSATFDEVHTFISLLDLDSHLSGCGLELPLHSAISAGHLPTVEALLDAGADPDGLGECDDEMAVNLAFDSGHDDIGLLLLKGGANLSYLSLRALRCIFSSADQELLVKLFEPISNYDWHGDLFLPLCSIALVGEYERYEVLDMLSERTGEELKSRGRYTPASEVPRLHWILDEVYRAQLHEFLDDEERSGRGLELILNVLTGVHIEQQARGILKDAIFGSTAISNHVLHPVPISESPALHTLVSRNSPNALGVFKDLAPNLAALDSEGNTALHVAAKWNRIACARQLLEYGIDVDVKNDEGKTALEIAFGKGHEEIAGELSRFSQDSLMDEAEG